MFLGILNKEAKFFYLAPNEVEILFYIAYGLNHKLYKNDWNEMREFKL